MQQQQQNSLHCNLQDQAVRVTGRASGLGAALCQTLASRSTRVMLEDRYEEHAHVMARKLSGNTQRFQPVACDVLSLPEHTVVTEMIVLPMREAS